MSEIKISKASPALIPQMMQIESEVTYRDRRPSHGFILNSFSADQLSNFIAHDVVLTAHINAQCVGFLVGAYTTSPSLNYLRNLWDKICWDDYAYQFEKFLWIERMAVLPSFHRQSIGQKLLLELSARDQSNLILTATIEKPIRNIQALSFYEKNGFKKAGTYQSDEFRNIQNYQSNLLVKMNSA